MTTYSATSVLWTKQWGTGPTSNETIAKKILMSFIEADVNNNKLDYTEQEILDMLELAYGRAGSTTPKDKARLTWNNFANPLKEAWFK